jgi:hypothetical protein
MISNVIINFIDIFEVCPIDDHLTSGISVEDEEE